MPLGPSVTTVPGVPYGYEGPMPDAATSVDPAGALNYSFTSDVYSAHAFRRWTLPFWNPHQGLGAPFLASGLPAVLYPLTPLVALLPRHAYEFAYLLNWLIAAGFTYRFLRVIGVGFTGAMLGGVTIVCSGFFQYYFAEREVIMVAAWFPPLLYAVERTLRERGWRWRHLALAGSIYCAVTGGQPESTFVALAAVTVYGVVSIAVLPARRAMLIDLAPGVAAGTLLSAPFWWNLADYVFNAYSAHEAGSAIARTELGWRTMASYVMPQLYGRLHTLPPDMVPQGWSWDLAPGWIPAAAALGVMFGTWEAFRIRSRPLLLVLGISVVVAGKIWGVWPLSTIDALPMLDRIVFPRYAAFVLAVSAAILAGAGWDAAMSKPPSAWLRAALAWIVAAFALYLMASIWREPVFRALQVRAFSVLIAMWVVAVPVALLWLRSRVHDSAAMAAIVAAGMVLQYAAFMPGSPPEMYAVLTLACLGAWLLLTALATSFSRRSVGPAPLVAIVVAVCALPPLVLAASERRGLPLRYDASTEPPYLKTLRELQAGTDGRAFALDGTPQPNFATAAGIDQINSLQAVLPHGVAGFFQRHLDPGTNPLWFSGNTGQRRSPDALAQFLAHRRYFELAAVRYILVRTTALPRDAGFRFLYADATTGVQIWENERALPRAFLACVDSRVAAIDDALARLPALADLRRSVVVDRLDADPCAAGAGAASGMLLDVVTGINDITVRYRAETPGLLVVADAYERGWRAAIDGAPAQVIRANGAFLAVAITGAGDHLVEFSYRPPSWGWSVAAAAVGLLILLAGAIASAARPRPPTFPSHVPSADRGSSRSARSSDPTAGPGRPSASRS